MTKGGWGRVEDGRTNARQCSEHTEMHKGMKRHAFVFRNKNVRSPSLTGAKNRFCRQNASRSCPTTWKRSGSDVNRRKREWRFQDQREVTATSTQRLQLTRLDTPGARKGGLACGSQSCWQEWVCTDKGWKQHAKVNLFGLQCAFFKITRPLHDLTLLY